MKFDSKPNYYDVLEITPEAGIKEIRDAYLRLKSAYGKESVALYSLFEPNEKEDLVREIEEAYLVLSSPDKRKEYDRCFHSFGEKTGELVFRRPKDEPESHESRHAPMDDTIGNEVLIAPSTDFINSPRKTENSTTTEEIKEFRNDPRPKRQDTVTPAPSTPEKAARNLPFDPDTETEWRGDLIRKVREYRSISVEELSELTKISRKYINAIEVENFSDLPASVYLRGFLIQISKHLGFPGEKLVATYLQRYRQSHPNKA